MKDKICLLVTKSNWGGAQRYVFDIATNLSKEEYDVSVICGGNGVLSEKLKDANIKVSLINNLSRDMKMVDDSRSLFKIFQILKSERPNVIHLNSPKAAGLGALSARLLGIKKIIYTVHGFTFNEDRPLFQKILIKFFSWLTILLSSKTILLSEFEHNQVKKWPFIKNKLIVIPLGIAEKTYLSKEESRKEISRLIKKDILQEQFIVGTIAELHKNKGYNYAIQALSQIEKAIYIIISEGEERQNIEAQIKRLGATNIFLTGNIPDASKYLKAFDLFLLPSIKEGLPYTLLEAADAKIPIISTNVGGIPNFIKNNFSGTLIESKNETKIKSKVQYTIENIEQMKKYAEELNKTLRKNYLLSTMILEINKQYK